MWRPVTLLITDPNLGEAAHRRVSAVCSNLAWLSWDVNRPQGRDRLLSQIADGQWALAISFYSDLILPPYALDAIDLPLNIHPALPRIRGVGHDVIPIVEKHGQVGATLHRMEAQVDSGEILDVRESGLDASHSFESLRTLNQSLSLASLDRLCVLLLEETDSAALESRLRRERNGQTYHWGPYYSRRYVAAMRAEHDSD